MDREYHRYRHNPSFFFPIALITVGVVWLLVNNGTIPVDNIYRLLPFWPVLLILAGLSVLFRRIWWPINLLIWGGAAVLLVAALITPPAFLTRVSPVELKHQVLREPLGQTSSANVRLDLSVNPVTVHGMKDSKDLVLADVYAANDLRLDTSGSGQKTVRLRENAGANFAWWRFDQLITQTSKPWDIGLNDSVPLDLRVDASTGQSRLDLTGLKLTALAVNASTGSMDLTLPEEQSISPLKLDASTGSMTLNLPANTAVDMAINASTGGITINLPQGAGVQVTITDGGTGGLNLPAAFKKTEGVQNRKEGVYENDAFSGAKAPIRISIDMSTGGITVH